MKYWHGYSDPIFLIMILCYIPLFYIGPVYSFLTGPSSPLPKNYSEKYITILSLIIGLLMASIGTIVFYRFDAKPFWWAPLLIIIPLLLLKLVYSAVSNWYGEGG